MYEMYVLLHRLQSSVSASSSAPSDADDPITALLALLNSLGNTYTDAQMKSSIWDLINLMLSLQPSAYQSSVDLLDDSGRELVKKAAAAKKALRRSASNYRYGLKQLQLVQDLFGNAMNHQGRPALTEKDINLLPAACFVSKKALEAPVDKPGHPLLTEEQWRTKESYLLQRFNSLKSIMLEDEALNKEAKRQLPLFVCEAWVPEVSMSSCSKFRHDCQ
jgi:hypothetical protein